MERLCYLRGVQFYMYTHHSQQEPVPLTRCRYANCGCDISVAFDPPKNKCHNHEPANHGSPAYKEESEIRCVRWHDYTVLHVSAFIVAYIRSDTGKLSVTGRA